MILHLSDLHFGTEKSACMAAIRLFCLEHEIEAVVVSGDLTQRARYTQFYDCKQFLDSLNLPYHLDGIVIDEFNSIIADKFGMTPYHELDYFYE